MKRRRRLPAVGLLIALGLLVTGCADIPAQTLPQALNFGNGQDTGLSAPQPPKDETPPNIVRGFVASSADPAGHHVGARAYLADSVKSTWNDNGPIVIIGDTFNTVTPTSGTLDLPKSEAGYSVVLRAQLVGQVGADHGFQAGSGDFQLTFHLTRQSDGSWRIVDPPDEVVLTQSAFLRYYQSVELYFFDPSFGVLVPDQRYVDADPATGVPGRIIDLLLSGPSSALSGAVKSAIPSGVGLETNVTQTSDGATVVNLTRLTGLTEAVKQQVAAQIVKSLQGVTNGTVRIESDGVELVAGHPDWQLRDLPSYSATTTPRADLPGLVVTHGKVVSLRDGAEIPGPAGNGGYSVVSAAQSVDGNELALVCRGPTGLQLRIGPYGKPANPVDLQAGQFTRPTWAPAGATGAASNEVWTVANGQVVRVVNTSQGTWVATPVDTSDVAQYGPITDLRLSRDGVRVAAVAGGHVVVGSVVVEQSSVAIKNVVALQESMITDAVGVDWLAQDSVVVATNQPTIPVVSLSVDGLIAKPYDSSNLTPPMTAITATADRPVIVVDSSGMWESSDRTEIWQSTPRNSGVGAVPFYPG